MQRAMVQMQHFKLHKTEQIDRQLATIFNCVSITLCIAVRRNMAYCGTCACCALRNTPSAHQ